MFIISLSDLTSNSLMDFVTRNDLSVHLNTLKDIYDLCIFLDLEGIYSYFLTLEEEYLSKGSTRNSNDNSYAGLVHKLHPIKYTNEIITESWSTKQSIRSRLTCCYCSTSLPFQQGFDLHMKRKSVICISCLNSFTYENHRVMNIKDTILIEMNNIITKEKSSNSIEAKLIRSADFNINDYPFLCVTYRHLGTWFRL